MRHPPDFSKLAKLARSLPEDRPWVPRLGRRSAGAEGYAGFDRRRMPRRQVDSPIYLGVIPEMCEKLRLSRIPVSVFKPLDGGWATDLSPQGVGLIVEKPIEVGGRHWLRLDPVAVRPTILPGRVVSCEPATLESNLDVVPAHPEAYRVRVAFLLQDATIPQRLGFVDDPITAVA